MRYILLLEEVSNLSIINKFIQDRIDIHDIFDMYNDFKDEFNPDSTYQSVSFVISHKRSDYYDNNDNAERVDVLFKLDEDFKVPNQRKKGDIERCIRLLRSKNSEFSIEINFRFEITTLYSGPINKSYINYKKICKSIDNINKRISSIYKCTSKKSEFDEDDIIFSRSGDIHYFNVDLKIKLDK